MNIWQLMGGVFIYQRLENKYEDMRNFRYLILSMQRGFSTDIWIFFYMNIDLPLLIFCCESYSQQKETCKKVFSTLQRTSKFSIVFGKNKCQTLKQTEMQTYMFRKYPSIFLIPIWTLWKLSVGNQLQTMLIYSRSVVTEAKRNDKRKCLLISKTDQAVSGDVKINTEIS